MDVADRKRDAAEYLISLIGETSDKQLADAASVVVTALIYERDMWDFAFAVADTLIFATSTPNYKIAYEAVLVHYWSEGEFCAYQNLHEEFQTCYCGAVGDFRNEAMPQECIENLGTEAALALETIVLERLEKSLER
jgi:hypothetical protein